MPGGEREAYEEIQPIWEAIAAKIDDGACMTYIGPDGAGHFVKMVHNGIEYGDMQLIAEAYDMMRRVLRHVERGEMADVFDEWNEGDARIVPDRDNGARFCASKTLRRASLWLT